MSHLPVLLNEVLHALNPQAGETYVDGTFGFGGYSEALLKHTQTTIYGFDRDPSVRTRATELSTDYGERFKFILSPFSDLKEQLAQKKITQVDGIVLDIGVSSMQLDQAERGFSFRKDGPLDMRMDQGKGVDTPSAADLVNTLSETDLRNVLWRFGEEKKASRIARALVSYREEQPFSRTEELAKIVREQFSMKEQHDRLDPATRTFQALRIAVNDELRELEEVLLAAEVLLKPGGRLVVVTFHSLEDRIVKQFFQRHSQAPSVSRHLPQGPTFEASFTLPSRKILTATDDEIAQNPRARSAKLRYGIRTEHPALQLEEFQAFSLSSLSDSLGQKNEKK